jgi:hypothetical protein
MGRPRKVFRSMKTVAIVGTSGSTRDQAPYHDRSIPIWMFNSQPLADWVKEKGRCDLVIELHQPGTFLNTPNLYTKWLKDNTEVPIYMLNQMEEVTASVKYPLDEIVEKYLKDFKRDGTVIQYFTSSVCYAIALAIYQGYERIELYGVDMANNTEYIYQRDGIALWFGIALGLGIEVYIPRNCAMFNSPRYGYDDDVNYTSREEFEKIASELQPMIEECFGKLKLAEGVVQGILGELEVIKTKGVKDPSELDDIGMRYSDAMNNHQQLIADYASLTGQYQLCRQLQMRVEKQMEAQGKAQEVMALNQQWKPL